MNSHEKERYSRHILLQGLTFNGVEKIRQGRVAVIGIGGLAAPLLTYLTVSGVGEITLIDHDHISTANLARQFLFTEKDIGKAKAVVAYENLRFLNSGVKLKPIISKVKKENFEELTAHSDLVVETVDSTLAKLLIHDLALKYHKPLIHGAALAWEGQFLTILPGTSCLRCFFPHLGDPPQNISSISANKLPWNEIGDSCSTEGVLSPLCGIVGSYQASEVIRFFTQPHDDLHVNKMLRIDLIRNRSYYLYPQAINCNCKQLSH